MSIYTGKRVVVTGGLGFIGSNLAIRLVELGAHVIVIDSVEPDCGANYFNIKPVCSRIQVVECSVGNTEVVTPLLRGQEVVFNLAGEVSHPRSMSDPERDLELNAVSQLRFLRACAAAAPGARVVYASTRQVYGVPVQLPVNEAHSTRPLDFNGVHKLAAEQYHTVFDRLGALDNVILRLSNVYGPRMALGVGGQGFLVTYLNRLVRGSSLEVYGDGAQLRDPVHVDDVVDAFLAAGSVKTQKRKIFNIAGPEALALRDIARIASNAAGVAPLTFRKFPEEQKPIDIGSFQADTRRASSSLGWSPSIDFASGIRSTLKYYELHAAHYLDVPRLRPIRPVASRPAAAKAKEALA